MQVAKWGNSLAVRLPAELVKRLGLKEGDEIEFHLRASPSEGLAVDVVRKPTLEELLDRIGKIKNRFPADYRFDRRDAYPAHRGGFSDGDDDEIK